jgi:pyridoxal/pyridoxine/pyridoxamine kinase
MTLTVDLSDLCCRSSGPVPVQVFCDVLTSNECELLAEMELRTVKDAMRACKKLHTEGCGDQQLPGSLRGEMPKEFVVIGNKVVAGVDGGEPRCEQYEVRFPFIDSYYIGTGDLFAALLLAWLYRFPTDFKRALENVISTIQDVLRITLSTADHRRRQRIETRHCETSLFLRR